jgi:hypothetical protein
MKSSIIHYYRITFGGFFQKIIHKPVFKKLSVCCMPVTSNGKMYGKAKGGNGIYPFKPPSAFDAF